MAGEIGAGFCLCSFVCCLIVVWGVFVVACFLLCTCVCVCVFFRFSFRVSFYFGSGYIRVRVPVTQFLYK